MISGAVLGVDVGWSATDDTTGACVIRWDEPRVHVRALRIPSNESVRRDLLESETKNHAILCAALDGPLRRGFDKIGEYRLAERLLTRRFSNLGVGKPGQSNSGNGLLLNEHANRIASNLLQIGIIQGAEHEEQIHDLGIVEAFPTSFLGVMLDKAKVPSSKAKSDAFFEHLAGPDNPKRLVPDDNRLAGLIKRLLPDRALALDEYSGVTDHELRAAVICALTALCVAQKNYVAVGDHRNGWIILPPLVEAGEAGLQPWAWEALQKNLKVALKELKGAPIDQPERRPQVVSHHSAHSGSKAI
jgi:predicted RNase H-like nuclease